MNTGLEKIFLGYQTFRKKYAMGDQSVMHYLSHYGQRPQLMVVACCDSRVDPALILQCDPGDLFVVRNVANIVPPYEKDEMHHGTSAALEFGTCFLKIAHLVLLGHSQCGGIEALISGDKSKDDFITNWVSLIKPDKISNDEVQLKNSDDYAKLALHQSYLNCLSFPWIKEKIDNQELIIHQWFFDIKTGQIFRYSHSKNEYIALDVA